MELNLSPNDWVDLFSKATKVDIPSPYGAHSEKLIDAAVLLVIGFENSRPHLLFTLRTQLVDHHRGQVSFPGGRRDQCDTNLFETATRETNEEVGIPSEKVSLIGELPMVLSSTGFRVTPYLAKLDPFINEIELKCNAAEIELPFWIPVTSLNSKSVFQQEWITRNNKRFPNFTYRWPTQSGEQKIWGMTGAIVKNLLDRIDLCVKGGL